MITYIKTNYPHNMINNLYVRWEYAIKSHDQAL